MFLWADVGSNRPSSDCGILTLRPLDQLYRVGEIGFPAPSSMPNDDKDLLGTPKAAITTQRKQKAQGVYLKLYLNNVGSLS